MRGCCDHRLRRIFHHFDPEGVFVSGRDGHFLRLCLFSEVKDGDTVQDVPVVNGSGQGQAEVTTRHFLTARVEFDCHGQPPAALK